MPLKLNKGLPLVQFKRPMSLRSQCLGRLYIYKKAFSTSDHLTPPQNKNKQAMSSTINYSTLADQLAEIGQQMNNNNGDSKEAMRKLSIQHLNDDPNVTTTKYNYGTKSNNSETNG
uniref:Uncharacterized protein n=1 Tax=Meloidogyne floridensis TaxID=298350 RepID=A0A915NHX5_9BILA